MIGTLVAVWHRWRIAQLVRQGLQIAPDCRLMDIPNFGSEPYLISIGPRVTISTRVSFINHDGATWVFRRDPRYREVIKFGRIVIHENCFIGSGATILPGVSIGPDAVVAANSVVTENVPPGTVVGGMPARVLTTVAAYAAKALAEMPAYDRAAYQSDKKAELLRLFPRPW